MAFGLCHAAQARTCRRIRPENARCRDPRAWRLESLLSQESLGEGDQHGGVNHNATGATRIVVMVSPPNAASNVAIWSGRPDRRLPLRLCRQHNRRRLRPPPSHRSKASRGCLLSLATPRPEQRRVRLELHATQPHVANATPRKRAAKRSAAMMLLPPFRRRPALVQSLFMGRGYIGMRRYRNRRSRGAGSGRSRARPLPLHW